MEILLSTIVTFITIFGIGILLYKQITAAIGLSMWANKLKRRDATQVEAEKALTFLKSVWYVPNKPKYWGACKTIYHSAVVSSQVDFETKMAIFNRLDKLKCHGVVRPIERKRKQHA
ncbi:hypothetical protein [Peribacillus acanthi]|uniref:hypothetical protein n=1 Tax=Peribacillus acanthi TaxID=2171554 RepID=UPI000D3E4649|nr:hypothetical protein [Peribacillus acanthi]